MRPPRLARTERRRAILEAVVPVFAEKGFHGVRTKELAAAAGVSEALLYRHFRGKDDLYAALLEHVHHARDHARDQAAFASMPLSTRKLVWGVRRLVEHMAQRTGPRHMMLPRLMANSLLDDGGFARSMLGSFQRDLFGDLGDALKAARNAGDAIDDGRSDTVQLWMLHHLLFGLRMLAMPRKAVVTYGVTRAELVDPITRFALRGLGLKDEAIERELAALAASRE